MKTKNLILMSIALTGMFFMTACEKDDNTADPMATTDQTIAEYAVSDPNFSILVQALTKADLVDVLNGRGNFTVFAPTNAAFNALFCYPWSNWNS